MTERTARPPRRRPPEERRAQILQAAMGLFARRGFARTTTREIAREAGIAEGTIYKHFASKQEILFAFLEPEVAARTNVLLQLSAEPDGDAAVRGLLRERLSTAARDLPFVKILFAEMLCDEEFARLVAERFQRPALHLLARAIAARTRAGQFRHIDPKLAAGALVGLFVPFVVMWPTLFPEEVTRYSPRRLADVLASIFLDGVRQRPAAGGAGEEEVREGDAARQSRDRTASHRKGAENAENGRTGVGWFVQDSTGQTNPRELSPLPGRKRRPSGVAGNPRVRRTAHAPSEDAAGDSSAGREAERGAP